MANKVLGNACPFLLKESMEELAINGGKAVFDDGEGKFIHPRITNGLVNEVKELKDKYDLSITAFHLFYIIFFFLERSAVFLLLFTFVVNNEYY